MPWAAAGAERDTPASGPRRTRAQTARRVGEDLANGVVALPDAGEARRERNVGNRQIRRLEQDPGRLAALGARQRERTTAHLCRDQAVELARAVAQPLGQPLDAFAVDDPVADQAHGACDDVRSVVPFGRTGCGVGPAAQTGPEPRLLRGGRRGVEPHVLPLGGARRTTGPAVDPRRRHAAEEPPVEAGILALGRLVAAIRVLDHGDSLTRGSHRYWRESDIAVPGAGAARSKDPRRRKGPLTWGCSHGAASSPRITDIADARLRRPPLTRPRRPTGGPSGVASEGRITTRGARSDATASGKYRIRL